MKPKKIITLKNAVVTEYETGPDAAGHLRKCVICRGEFRPGEHWLRMTRPGEYSIGAHTTCLAKKEAQL